MFIEIELLLYCKKKQKTYLSIMLWEMWRSVIMSIMLMHNKNVQYFLIFKYSLNFIITFINNTNQNDYIM